MKCNTGTSNIGLYFSYKYMTNQLHMSNEKQINYNNDKLTNILNQMSFLIIML